MMFYTQQSRKIFSNGIFGFIVFYLALMLMGSAEWPCFCFDRIFHLHFCWRSSSHFWTVWWSSGCKFMIGLAHRNASFWTFLLIFSNWWNMSAKLTPLCFRMVHLEDHWSLYPKDTHLARHGARMAWNLHYRRAWASIWYGSILLANF